jgi:hypothetical protein
VIDNVTVSSVEHDGLVDFRASVSANGYSTANSVVTKDMYDKELVIRLLVSKYEQELSKFFINNEVAISL